MAMLVYQRVYGGTWDHYIYIYKWPKINRKLMLAVVISYKLEPYFIGILIPLIFGR